METTPSEATTVHPFSDFAQTRGKDTSESDTRDRLLDAAQKLFAEKGFAATSLRSITKEAGANLAAVNYHFGSKDNLIVELLARGVRPLNQHRIFMLDEFEREVGDAPLEVEKILDALYRPCFVFCADKSRMPFLRLLGKSLHEEGPYSIILAEREWNPLVQRFMGACKKSLPELPLDLVYWRFHFAIGSLIHCLSQHESLTVLSQGQCTLKDPEEVIQDLITFTAAGMKAAANRRADQTNS